MSSLKDYQPQLHSRILRPLIKSSIRQLFRILAPVKITGQENIPFGQPYVTAANHVSIYDPPFLLSFWPEMMEAIGAADVFDKPGQGQLLRMYGVIPVHRGDYDRVLIDTIQAILKAGRPLLIAPEGGRSHVPAMRRAKAGIAHIVEQAQVKVLPVGIVGTTDDFWARASHGERPQLEMRIGKPFELPPVTGKGADRRESRQRNADLVMSYIAGLLPEEYRGVYADSAIPPAQTS
jgi:1-acyl-sn-glycerol-3-phosphate acyltransferase